MPTERYNKRVDALRWCSVDSGRSEKAARAGTLFGPAAFMD
jgi:hypothetical protein